jgi:hypothetical protein
MTDVRYKGLTVLIKTYLYIAYGELLWLCQSWIDIIEVDALIIGHKPNLEKTYESWIDIIEVDALIIGHKPNLEKTYESWIDIIEVDANKLLYFC